MSDLMPTISKGCCHSPFGQGRLVAEGFEGRGEIELRGLVAAAGRSAPFQQVVGQEADGRLAGRRGRSPWPPARRRQGAGGRRGRLLLGAGEHRRDGAASRPAPRTMPRLPIQASRFGLFIRDETSMGSNDQFAGDCRTLQPVHGILCRPRGRRDVSPEAPSIGRHCRRNHAIGFASNGRARGHEDSPPSETSRRPVACGKVSWAGWSVQALRRERPLRREGLPPCSPPPPTLCFLGRAEPCCEPRYATVSISTGPSRRRPCRRPPRRCAISATSGRGGTTCSPRRCCSIRTLSTSRPCRRSSSAIRSSPSGSTCWTTRGSPRCCSAGC